MAESTNISWAHSTFNPWLGCTNVSPGCDHCYAEALAKRTGLVEWGNHPRRRTSAAYWRQPLAWNRKAMASGQPWRVFCASMADVFDNQVPDEWRSDLWKVIEQTPNLIWMLLTKRPQNIGPMLPPGWGGGWPNVWFGATVENQEEANRRIPHLFDVPARVHFLSCEPLLGPVDLRRIDINGDCEMDCWPPTNDMPVGISWVICGGESGPRARPMHPAWVRSLRDQCVAADVPFHFKQWGEWKPLCQFEEQTIICNGPDAVVGIGGEYIVDTDIANPPTSVFTFRVGKRRAGCLLDGRENKEFPGAFRGS